VFARVRHLEPGRPLSPGVAALVAYLDRNLEPAWRILVHPRLEGVRLDVVVFQALVGLTIFQVTDVLPPGPQRPPVDLAGYARDTLVRLMTDFAGSDGPDAGSAALIRTAAYVHGLDQPQVDALLATPPTRTPCFGQDALEPANLARIVPGAHRLRRGNWDPAWNDFLMTWLQPAHHEPERQHPLVLTPEQRRHVQTHPGHRGLRGPVGAGKSRVLAWRAALLASEGKQVLIVCMTPGLRHDLRALLSRTPIAFAWQQLVITDLMGLCKGVVVEAGCPEPPADAGTCSPDTRALSRAAEAALARLPHRRYDAILVDEGHLFHPDAVRLLAAMLTRHDELWLVHDDPPGGEGPAAELATWLDRLPVSELPRFDRHWARLTPVHARPLSLAWGAALFAALRDLEIAHPVLQDVREARDREVAGLTCEWRPIPAALWFDEVVASVKALSLERARRPDVTVLVPEPIRGLPETLIRDRLKGVFERVFDMSDRPYPVRRAHLATGLPRLEVSHVMAFDGWDRSEVVLLVPEYHPGYDVLDVLVYTVLSRARHRVHVLDAGSRYRDFLDVLAPPLR
jgi:hypothetical protein